MDAFCTDLTRPGPANTSYRQAYFGGDNTLITYKENGILKNPISLNTALQNGIVQIVGDSYYGGFTAEIKPSKKGIKLVRLNTSGIWLGRDMEPGLLSPEFVNQFDHPSYDTRLKIWQKIYDLEKKNPEVIKKRTDEFLEYFVKEKFSSGSMKITKKEDGKILIHESGGNGKTPINDYFNRPFRDFYNDMPGNDLALCVSIDTSITLSLKGKLHGVMPFEIEFTSDRKITISAELNKVHFYKDRGKVFDATLKIHYESENEAAKEQECKIQPTLIICYPLTESTINLNVCGMDVSANLKGVEFGL